jgi:hypothetical protein
MIPATITATATIVMIFQTSRFLRRTRFCCWIGGDGREVTRGAGSSDGWGSGERRGGRAVGDLEGQAGAGWRDVLLVDGVDAGKGEDAGMGR